MKALSVKPLWGTLILLGSKTVEVRKFATAYRGDLLICSTRERVPETIPGHALCVVTLKDIVPFTKDMCEAAQVEPDDWEPGWLAWVLENPRMIEPFPVKGQLKLWECDEPVNIGYASTDTSDEAEQYFFDNYDALFI